MFADVVNFSSCGFVVDSGKHFAEQTHGYETDADDDQEYGEKGQRAVIVKDTEVVDKFFP